MFWKESPGNDLVWIIVNCQHTTERHTEMYDRADHVIHECFITSLGQMLAIPLEISAMKGKNTSDAEDVGLRSY